jgi:hypothetical protein
MERIIMSVAVLFEQIKQLPPQDQTALLQLMQEHQAGLPRPLDEVFEDPSPEEILADIRLGLSDALAGRVRPWDEVMAELRAEFDFDGD